MVTMLIYLFCPVHFRVLFVWCIEQTMNDKVSFVIFRRWCKQGGCWMMKQSSVTTLTWAALINLTKRLAPLAGHAPPPMDFLCNHLPVYGPEHRRNYIVFWRTSMVEKKQNQLQCMLHGIWHVRGFILHAAKKEVTVQKWTVGDRKAGTGGIFSSHRAGYLVVWCTAHY